jgi:D-alanyl-lipoteichoic acid acyltransferase DltB (MBOAT superfamily)
MIFNSVTFLLFLMIVVCLYWLLPTKARLLLILVSSLTFYGFWRWEFLPLLLFSAFIDWWVALRMYRKPKSTRRSLLLISLITNISLLFYFKYLIFFTENFLFLVSYFGIDISPITLNIILPLGISFYTFQTISYSIDVYREKIKPEKSFLLYSCYVTFFPQLVAGPVLRASEVIYQFTKPAGLSVNTIICGLRRILYGLFLKVVLADNISPFVDAGYSMPLEAISALDVLSLSFLFGFQIYFDFSAYSHIALGCAKLMGITFPENFNFPYLSSSPKEFWKRWHISLSSWVRDYIYLPLANSKSQSTSKEGLSEAILDNYTLPLFLTWMIMGFWHGANWTFLFWGIYHALVIFIYRLVQPYTARFRGYTRRILGWILTLPVIMLSWIPFRCESVQQAISMFAKLLYPNNYTWLGLRENTYLITALLLVGVILIYNVRNNIVFFLNLRASSLNVLNFVFIMFISILVFIFLRPINQFIYFQF